MTTTLDFQALTSSASNEWYTPLYIIEKARSVMGGIELDPASCALAQTWIKAIHYYTQSDDGFNQPWIAETFWLNPPYGKRNRNTGIHGSSAWLEKVHREHQSGNVKQAIVLARGDSKGFQLLTRNYPLVDCKRINFIDGDGNPSTQGVPGSRIFGLGVDEENFAKQFEDIGILLRAVTR